MAKPVRFPEQSHQFNPPKGMSEDDCGTLPACAARVSGRLTYVSCWKLTEEEKEQVARTGVIWVGAVSMQPPLIVSGFKPFESSLDHHDN